VKVGVTGGAGNGTGAGVGVGVGVGLGVGEAAGVAEPAARAGETAGPPSIAKAATATIVLRAALIGRDGCRAVSLLQLIGFLSAGKTRHFRPNHHLAHESYTIIRINVLNRTSGDVPVIPDSDLERVLVVTAHPDDVDFGAAGTLAGWAAQGVAITYCIITDGDAGGFDPAVPRSEIPGIRRAEQVAAAAACGVTDVRFLGYKDGELTVTHGLRRDISRVIRQVRPQRMLIQSPERNWQRIPASHPDHLAAGEAAIQSVYPDARNPFAHPSLLQDEGLDAWSVSEVWVMGHHTLEHYVDMTDTFETKIAALRAHDSQTSHMEDLPGMLRMWSARMAEQAGLPDGRLAEGFFVSIMPA